MALSVRTALLSLSLLCVAVSGVVADTLLSSFEQNLDTTIGLTWQTRPLSTQYVTAGATDGTYAIQIEHGTEWTNETTDDFMLGGRETAQLVATHDFLEIDVTTPPDIAWRQLFVVMQGGDPYSGWLQAEQFDLVANQTQTISLDLNSTVDGSATGESYREHAAAVAANPDGWWELYLIFQGEDQSGAVMVTTTIDNVRFTGGSDILLGDVNLDGEVNGLDVDPFVDVLLNGPYQGEADMDGNGEVNGLDVDPFVVAVVGGGGALAVPEPSTMMLALLGLVGAAIAWRRR
jgi:hypothetical protein